jgi:NAD(P)-dependent dehydrogenase (short-subunit alcohol dehydrogenase family)
MRELTGRVAVVTGAGSGIGLAMAQAFAARGMALALADVEEAALAAAARTLGAAGADVLAQRVDVAEAAQVDAFADAVFARFGAVHLLCNNAGVAGPALRMPAWLSRPQDWRWILDVNLMGVVHGVRAFVPRMLAGGDEGHVVNTASVAGLLTGADPYFVSKHGVACLTEGLYKDLKAIGAKVSASVLCPGLVRTAIVDAQRNRDPRYGGPIDAASLPEAVRQGAAAFRQAIDQGLAPTVIADAVLEAVLADRYWIVPAQPPLLEQIAVRMHDVLERRNPTPPPPPAAPRPE